MGELCLAFATIFLCGHHIFVCGGVRVDLAWGLQLEKAKINLGKGKVGTLEPRRRINMGLHFCVHSSTPIEIMFPSVRTAKSWQLVCKELATGVLKGGKRNAMSWKKE